MTEEVIEETGTEEVQKNIQISLAKANKLRNRIQTFLDELERKIAKEVSSPMVFYPGTKIAEVETARKDKKVLVSNLFNDFAFSNNLLANLKIVISAKNSECGVSQVMTQIEQTNRFIQAFERIFTSRLQTFKEEDAKFSLKRIIEASRSENQNWASGSTVTFSANVYSESDLEAEEQSLKSLKKALMTLEENRNSLNYSNTISISADVFEWLEARGLI